MNNRAAISAQLVDVRNVGQHKAIKLTVHVPAEQAQLVMAAFGWPTMVEPVPVALARLDLEAIKSGDAAPDREEIEKSDRACSSRSNKPVAPDKRLAQRAALLCKDPLFHKWLEEISGVEKVEEADARTYIISKCGVTSRADIVPGTDAAIAFDEICAAFTVWRDADQYVEAAE